MADVQFISEIMILTIRKEITGFDQDTIDQFYADYDDPAETLPSFDEEAFDAAFESMKKTLSEIYTLNESVGRYGRTLANFYSLWGMLLLAPPDGIPPATFGERYACFMEQVTKAIGGETPVIVDAQGPSKKEQAIATYAANARGASTDVTPRLERHKALIAGLAD